MLQGQRALEDNGTVKGNSVFWMPNGTVEARWQLERLMGDSYFILNAAEVGFVWVVCTREKRAMFYLFVTLLMYCFSASVCSKWCTKWWTPPTHTTRAESGYSRKIPAEGFPPSLWWPPCLRMVAAGECEIIHMMMPLWWPTDLFTVVLRRRAWEALSKSLLWLLRFQVSKLPLQLLRLEGNSWDSQHVAFSTWWEKPKYPSLCS